MAGLVPVADHAGRSPNIKPVNRVSPAVNNNTRPLNRTSSMRGRFGGASLINADNSQRAQRIPAKPPSSDSRRPSFNIWRIRRGRPAPSAILIPISCSRTSARAIDRLATLTHAMSKTNPTAPIRTSNVDLAAVENGGLVLGCSDMFFGHRHNLIMPGRAANMSDGWETKRRRGPGHDWAIIKLGRPGHIHRVEVDTSHFKGNFPESCSIDSCNLPNATTEELTNLSTQWSSILERTKLQANTRHYFDQELQNVSLATHLRFSIFPDGGVSRLRVYGTLAD